jgi:dCTP deaminase
MAFLGNETLKKLLENSDIISEFSENRIKNGAYEMSLGTQVFQTDSLPREVKELKEGACIEIKPGQFALLLTKEYVKIPEDKIAFISIKAGVKFKGLVNVSGFHVDSGFEGNLLFSVYNAGPSSIILRNGEAYFPMWFSEVTEKQSYKGNHEKQTRIPIGPIESLSQGEIVSPNVLNKKIDDVNLRINVLEKDQKANNYIAVTALGVMVGIFIKFIFDFTALDKGFDKGIELKSKEIVIDSSINQKLVEKKKLIQQIDSLKRVRENLHELTK